jgi:hypothetical protein
MPIPLDELARQLYVDPGDVRVILESLSDDTVSDVVTDELGGEVRLILDRHGEHTLPHLWNQADMDTWREETGTPNPDGNRHVPGVFGARPPDGA